MSATNLIDCQEEEAIDEDRPDSNVGKDTCRQTVRIDGDGTIPVQSNKVPSQRPRNSWEVNEPWRGWMPKVESREIPEVHHQDQLGPPEMGANEEHDEGELKEVIENEVTSNAASCLDICFVLGEERPDISDLGDEENNPEMVSLPQYQVLEDIYQ